MIRAEKANRIMQLYESDYDNFLDKLRAKRKAKKEEAAKKKAEADQADKSLSEAEAHKKKHLGEKAKELLDKAGGIEGAASTIQNVIKFFKGDSPSNYEVDIGEGDENKEKMIMGLPPVAVYVGGGLLFLGLLYTASRVLKKNKAPMQQVPVQASIPEPVLQQAA